MSISLDAFLNPGDGGVKFALTRRTFVSRYADGSKFFWAPLVDARGD
jgi:hypothetical protein